MTHDVGVPPRFPAISALRAPRWARHALELTLFGFITWAGLQLEDRFNGLIVEELTVDETPVTLYATNSAAQKPLAIVAHGFAGSRQMMDQISVTLARAGFAVAAFDFPGHGRNPTPMSPDITRIEGTTEQLVLSTLEVLDALRARDGISDQAVLIGHSMATDVVIRAAAQRDGIAAVAAISMYSEAVTPAHPSNLLIISGASESRLREVGLDAIAQIAPGMGEGITVTQGEDTRRAIAAPGVGHVGVLYSETTLNELALWLTSSVNLPPTTRADMTGWIAGGLLAAIVLLAWPIAGNLPAKSAETASLRPKEFLFAIAAPILPTLGVAYVVPTSLGAFSSFATLTAVFATWGLVQIALLRRARLNMPRPDGLAIAFYLVWGLGIFALALDRYGAAFLPTGPRFGVMALMLLGAVPLMLADAMLTQPGALWRRALARVVLITNLAAAMAISPGGLGLSFVVLPVLVLFFVVYGSLSRIAAARRGAGSAALGSGLALAWAIAASAPLFATAP